MKRFGNFILAFAMVGLSVHSSSAQDLDQVVRDINHKYKSMGDIISYDVRSTNKSLLADTVRFKYSTHVICNSINQHDSIKDFICMTASDKFLLAFLDKALWQYDTILQTAETEVIQPPYTQMRRGYFKWAPFSPLLFKAHVIDPAIWNASVSEYTIDTHADTLTIAMCNSIPNEPHFDDNDPLVGARERVIKISLRDTLIFYYEEKLTITKRPEVNRYWISNYRVYDDRIAYDSMSTLVNTYLETVPVKRNPDYAKLIRENQVDLFDHFDDSFIMYDLRGDSTRLMDLRTRYTLVYFWFSGCPPCSKAAPVLNQLVMDTLPQHMDIIGINFLNHSSAKIRDYVDRKLLVFDQYYLADRKGISFLDWYGAPTFVFYDRSTRRVVDYREGFAEEVEEWLKKSIGELAGK